MNKTAIFSKLILFTTVLAGCGGGGSDSAGGASGGDPVAVENPFFEAEVDATSTTDFTYMNLTTGETLPLSEEEAANSTLWHVAFRRNSIKLNSGVSGPGMVKGAVVSAQEDFYAENGEALASVFLNATADSELEHLTGPLTAPAKITEEQILTPFIGSGEVVATKMDMGWYWYDFTTHAITVNDNTGWLLQSGEGNSYARVRATALTYSSQAGLDVTFEFDVQPADSVQLATTALFQAHVDASGGEICYDFDVGSVISCVGNAWDLKLGVSGRDWYLRSNGGVSGPGNGAPFGPFAWDGELENYTSATIDPAGTAISFLYAKDSTSGVFADQLWYAYNLTGQHKLHPNYRVYWIDTDNGEANSEKYAVQITGYYNSIGVSGYVKLRWLKISN